VTKRYSSRRQEEFFQPCRLRVGVRYSDGRASHYNLVFQNMLTHAISKRYVKRADDDGHWTESLWVDEAVFQDEAQTRFSIGSIRGEPGALMMATIDLKRNALALAKRTAEERSWPFDLQSDIVPWAEIVSGPQARCLVCDSRWGHDYYGGYHRSHEPSVCPTCRKAVAAYNALSAKFEDFSIYRFALSRLGGDYEYRQGFSKDNYDIIALKALISVASSSIKHGDKLGPILGYEKYGRTPAYSGETAPWRIEALKDAIAAINRHVNRAYDVGLRHGSNLLEKLRTGEMHPNDFSDLREEKK